MSGQITLTLSDGVLQRAEQLARNSRRPVADLLADAIEATFNPLGPTSEILPPVADLPDDKLLQVVDSMMAPAQARRLSKLLERQREELLTPAERTELMAIMQAHDAGLLRKAQAVAEAARRGLRGPRKP